MAVRPSLNVWAALAFSSNRVDESRMQEFRQLDLDRLLSPLGPIGRSQLAVLYGSWFSRMVVYA